MDRVSVAKRFRLEKREHVHSEYSFWEEVTVVATNDDPEVLWQLADNFDAPLRKNRTQWMVVKNEEREAITTMKELMHLASDDA